MPQHFNVVETTLYVTIKTDFVMCLPQLVLNTLKGNKIEIGAISQYK